MKTLGIDTGGTFTDFVYYNNGVMQIHKVLSSPAAPELAILQGLKDLSISDQDFSELIIVHGSTVATNAVLENKGVRTVYITNKGLADVLSIGRQERANLYQLQDDPKPVPVEKALCLELDCRIAANGEEIKSIDILQLQSLRDKLIQLKPESVAINFLFSFVNDVHEQQVAKTLPTHLFISSSAQILPEFKEYERGIATWLNAYIGPIMHRYLSSLSLTLGKTISVMQSSGGTIDAAQAGFTAVKLLLSGPAGGLTAAHYIAKQAHNHRLLTFDMGGTSTDVALIDGEIQLTNEGRIGAYPVAVPMVDLHTIGAGGGSIAFVDEGGLLQVGPSSAGADPGPACYGRGGTLATVTDANLVLGRLRADAFLAGNMRLDIGAAQNAIAKIASKLGLDVEGTAHGIIQIANELMARALRVMSVQRGLDPKELVLVSFGGAGGLHVCALAQSLSISSAMVPINAGVLSAFGMLVAPRSRDLSLTLNFSFDSLNLTELNTHFERLISEAKFALQQEGVNADDMHIKHSIDARYHGQSYYLNVPWTDPHSSAEAFHRTHLLRYGHRLSQPIELVNIRVRACSATPQLDLSGLNADVKKPVITKGRVVGFDQDIDIIERTGLPPGFSFVGPALVTESVSTTYIDSDWECTVDPWFNLLINKIQR